MPRTRRFFLDLLRRGGLRLFGFFTRCEDKGILPKASSWIKRSVLGALVAGISALSAGALLDCIMCYAPIEPEPIIENPSADPNPTAGANSVQITARVYIEYAPEDYYIARASSILADDTTEMEATDGSFDSQEEDVQTTIYVGDLDTGIVKVYIQAANNDDEWDYGEEEINLHISDEE